MSNYADYVPSTLRDVQDRIKKACLKCGRSADEVTLVAVSKTHPIEAIHIALEQGQLHFGENRVQDLTEKMNAFDSHSDIEWHMIGTLQTNKIKYMASRVNWIHSVPKLKALKKIEKRAAQEKRVIKVLIQVNISDEDQKSGCDPADVPKLIESAEKMEHVKIMGLMGMATFADNPETVRPEFQLLRKLIESERQKKYKSADLRHLSMGMTNDLEVAIEEGATMVRIGTAIFGKRD